eukprot:scaffold13462_cov36-Cyclotella_meneghiniana.AAC.4
MPENRESPLCLQILTTMALRPLLLNDDPADFGQQPRAHRLISVQSSPPPGFTSTFKTYLQHKLEKITKTNNTIATLLDPSRWTHPDIPSWQMLWLLILMCLQFKDMYGMGVNIDTAWSDFAKSPLAPIRFKGMGICGAADRRFSQFIGAAVQSITPLLDRRDDNNNIIQGRLHLPSIANLFKN